ncbi:hypothetical protein ACK9YZ_06855 [Rhizobium sp. ZK1]|uniref:hypothetical protein n=1 Tax=Rhizobium sp. ZK1 TaxID=3389872 RepID=UPI0039F669C9
MSYPEALRALNQAAYAAARACQNEDEKRQLKRICFETDELVDALPSRMADFCGEVPALQSALVEGARLP